MTIKNRALRVISLLLSFALIHSAFGMQAWAGVATIVGSVSTPVGGSNAAASVTGNARTVKTAMFPAATSLNSVSMSGVRTLPVASSFRADGAVVRRTPGAIGAPALGAISRAASTPENQAAPAVTGSEQAPVVAANATVDAAIPAATASIQADARTGPSTFGVRARVAQRLAEMASAFGFRKDAALSGNKADASAVSGVAANSAPHASGLTKAPALSVSGAANDAPEKDKVSQNGGGDNAPPAPKADQAPAPKGRHWLIPFFVLLAGLLIIQFGLEAQGVALAQLTHEAFGDFTILATALLFSQGGSMLGQARSSEVINRFGRRNTYLVGNVIRGLTIAAILGLLSLHAMPVMGMYALYMMNGIVTGIVATADSTLRKDIIGVQHLLQFKLTWQLLAEIIGTYAPQYLGRAVTTWGASAITAIYPIALIGAMAYLWMVRILPKDAKAADGAAAGPTAGLGERLKGMIAAVKAFFVSVYGVVRHPVAAAKRAWASLKASSLADGAKYVWKSPMLLYSLLGAVLFDVQNIIIYRMLAPGAAQLQYGPAHMSQAAGDMVGMYSSGGLYLAIVMVFLPLAVSFGQRLWRRYVSKKPEEAKKAYTFEDRERDLKKAYRSTLVWAALGVPAVFLLATFALPASTLGAAVALPGWFTANWLGAKFAALTVIEASLVVYGFLQVAASVKLNNLFAVALPDSKLYPQGSPERARADEENQKAFAFEGFSMTALSMALIFALRPLFSHLTTFNPFPYIAWSLIPAVAVLAFIVFRLFRAKLPPADTIGGASAAAPAEQKK